jgi:hypothetical protein
MDDAIRVIVPPSTMDASSRALSNGRDAAGIRDGGRSVHASIAARPLTEAEARSLLRAAGIPATPEFSRPR